MSFGSTLVIQAAIRYFKETTIERKLLQMANVYMEEADFDDSDTWFHDGKSDEPVEQEVNIEVTVMIIKFTSVSLQRIKIKLSLHVCNVYIQHHSPSETLMARF